MTTKNSLPRFLSPLRYPGGKSCISKFMSALLADNDLEGVDYAEPYAGGAGLALFLLMSGLVSNIHINDLDKSIYAFWHVLLSSPDELCSWVSTVDVNLENWQYFHDMQNCPQKVSESDLAKSTFFLNRTNVSGVISGGPIGGRKQEGKYTLDVRFNRADLIKRIERISKYADHISLSNEDGIEFINGLNHNEDCFVYLDPPYYRKAPGLYMNFFEREDHERLASFVRELNAPWMVSYDYDEFILSLYTTPCRVKYQLSQCASNRVGDEILIFKDSLKYQHAVSLLHQAETV